MEQWNSGTMEQWNCGTIEQWNQRLRNIASNSLTIIAVAPQI